MGLFLMATRFASSVLGKALWPRDLKTSLLTIFPPITAELCLNFYRSPGEEIPAPFPSSWKLLLTRPWTVSDSITGHKVSSSSDPFPALVGLGLCHGGKAFAALLLCVCLPGEDAGRVSRLSIAPSASLFPDLHPKQKLSRRAQQILGEELSRG